MCASSLCKTVFSTVTKNTHKICYTRTPTTSLSNGSFTSPSEPHGTTIKYAVYCGQNIVPSVTLFGWWECLKSEIQGAKQSVTFPAWCLIFFPTLLAYGPRFQLPATSPGGMSLFLATSEQGWLSKFSSNFSNSWTLAFLKFPVETPPPTPQVSLYLISFSSWYSIIASSQWAALRLEKSSRWWGQRN